MPGIGLGLGVAIVRARALGPEGLFADGEQGVWYDPSDLSTLFQDAAGTVPVTASGDPVELMRDKSGRGNDLTLVNAVLNDAAGLRSIVFNGTTTAVTAASVDFTGTDKVTVWAGLRKLSDATAGIVVELSSGPANHGAFALIAPGTTNTPDYTFASQGTIARLVTTPANYPATERNVVTGAGDIAGDSVAIRVDGRHAIDAVLDQGAGPYGDYPLFVGARDSAGVFFTGNLYGLIVRGVASNLAEITSTEQYIAGKAGVTL
jgi:hypothetical protein